MIAPLSTAEPGVGAAGWASGSQTCNGTKPALMPNPISSSAMVRSRSAAAATAAGRAPIARLPAAVAASMNPSSRQVSPSTASAM